ncbi:hypothetical protein AB0K27_09560 [Micromonospora echinospora]|uniref:hypothetical protein n=1 Tax=Micromonospora echinospora TaxID=1877 RepID=UPI0034189C4B
MSSPTDGLVPVHIGQPEPGSQREQMLLVQTEYARERFGPRSFRVPGDLNWVEKGLQPRWLGMETSDCAVAIEPGFYHSEGADERDRFLAGARQREELALAVAVMGNVNDDSPRSVLSRFDASVNLGVRFTSVSGRRLPAGTRPEIAPDLSSADRDLAIRLLTRPADAPWWALKLTGAQLVRGDGSGTMTYEPEGELHPILVDALGEPVVAAWSSPAGDQRWYIIPDVTRWNNILGWLVERALPEYAPNALRRARSPHFIDPNLQTTDELSARQALAELEARYAEEKLRIEEELREAKERAEPVRYGLLYSSGAELVRAVAAVLDAAGLRTVDLDEEFGTKSADLLVSADGFPYRLVEIKAAGGAAQENLVGYLQRHLDTWPQLRPDQPVTGGVLVVNHQHKLHPSERTAQVYSRPEFVATLPFTVLSTVDLFNWWRTGNWAEIHKAVLGNEPLPNSATSAPPTPPLSATESTVPPPAQRRRWWSSRTPHLVTPARTAVAARPLDGWAAWKSTKAIPSALQPVRLPSQS